MSAARRASLEQCSLSWGSRACWTRSGGWTCQGGLPGTMTSETLLLLWLCLAAIRTPTMVQAGCRPRPTSGQPGGRRASRRTWPQFLQTAQASSSTSGLSASPRAASAVIARTRTTLLAPRRRSAPGRAPGSGPAAGGPSGSWRRPRAGSAGPCPRRLCAKQRAWSPAARHASRLRRRMPRATKSQHSSSSSLVPLARRPRSFGRSGTLQPCSRSLDT
mmetsp:Transcript_115293/g.321246  ORF Transcript_115293/g.321246 Transcript_115293/m.321246 type:complete len:218 (-) Transcript_115293:68-721(-)